MYNILIVDDELLERNGIKMLLRKFDFDLNIAEAENGKKALEYIKSNPVDILFSDIKMPLMDGLELCENAKKINPDLKIIIYSAYGEFDYTKKAINLKVDNYVLKPINQLEFKKIMNETIDLCIKEEENKKKHEMILQIYEKGIHHEKAKVLHDLLSNAYTEENIHERLKYSGLDLTEKYIQMAIIGFQSRFFDLREDDFKKMLDEIIKYKYEYLNLNEHQSVLFLIDTQPFERKQLFELGNGLLNRISSNFNLIAYIVLGDVINGVRQICEEYSKIERLLDYSFFSDESFVLFTDFLFDKNSTLLNSIDTITNNIYRCIEIGDDYGTRKGIDNFFIAVKGKKTLSHLIAKYTCIEILKRILEKEYNAIPQDFQDVMERIFNSKTLTELKEITYSYLSVIKQQSPEISDESSKKAIKDAIRIIDENYMKDIGVEWISKQVYLSPNYLSFLFKRETGQTIIRYITGLRFKKAVELLSDTNMKIVDICEKLGYTNTSYFCRIFKDYFGVSPQEYRNPTVKS